MMGMPSTILYGIKPLKIPITEQIKICIYKAGEKSSFYMEEDSNEKDIDNK